MELILWRHAEAEDGSPDSGRKLTAKGKKQAEAMAAWLKHRLPRNCRIVASPARRAQQTAQALTVDFETLPEIAAGASAESLLGAVGWPGTRDAILVVGHQPTLGEVVALLLADNKESWAIKKGAVWWITNRDRQYGSQTLLKLAISPDLL
ncbi:MAG TPA: phosphohistidine phosphatase SixA [Sulfuricella sp.]|nr:phosphohistidine phosphatase SixA [Sulfuricella sp.]